MKKPKNDFRPLIHIGSLLLLLTLVGFACTFEDIDIPKTKTNYTSPSKSSAELEAEKEARKLREKRREPVKVIGTDASIDYNHRYYEKVSLLEVTIKNLSDKDIRAFKIRAVYHDVWGNQAGIYKSYYSDKYDVLKAKDNLTFKWRDDDSFRTESLHTLDKYDVKPKITIYDIVYSDGTKASDY